MEPLTIQIITKNNEKVITGALKSVQKLGCRIIVADTGSTDSTVEICRSLGVEVLAFKEEDRSEIRNRLTEYAGTPWNFYLDPWESVIKGHKDILDACRNPGKSRSFYATLFQSNTLTKDIRLWQTGLLFTNPVFECLTDSNASYLDVVITAKRDPRVLKPLVDSWRSRDPASPEPYYYESCILLSQMDYQGFLKTSDQFLFRESNQLMPIIMTRYYRSIVFLKVKKDPEQAIRNVIPCLITQPLMSEFWCVLGDVYYFLLRNFSKARAFYQNAIDMGKKRSKHDNWPLEIEKYKDYPAKMITQCDHKVKKVEYYKRAL